MGRGMARIYVSATYSDLKEHREKVYRVLRQLGHDAVAMEDYVATDQRLLARCLADVEACHLYVWASSPAPAGWRSARWRPAPTCWPGCARTG